MSSQEDVFHIGTSYPQPATADPQASGNPSKSEAETVQKPSIRLLDGISREDDLEHGPLLLDMGLAPGTAQDYQLPINTELDIDPDIGSEDSNNRMGPHYNPAQIPGFSNLSTLRPFSEVDDTQSLSDSAPGNSLSLPTESIKSRRLRVSDETLLLGIQHSPFSQLHAGIPEQLELETAGDDWVNQLPKTQNMAPWPWKLQFEWVDGHLLFAGEQFSTYRPSSPAPSNRCTVDTEDRLDDYTLETASVISNVIENDLTLSGLKSQIISKIEDMLIETLESRYWTTHGPHRSNQQGSRSSSQKQQTSHAPYNTNRGIRGNSNRVFRNGRRTMNNSGSDEDEGDESSSDGQGGRFRCPFLLREPQFADRRCMRSFRYISAMKGHLYKSHHPDYCRQCMQTFYDKAMKTHHICKPRKQKFRLAFMTQEQYEDVRKRVDKNKSHKEQWENIFTILFPDEELPDNPYQEDIAAVREAHIGRFIHKELPPLLEQQLSEMPVQFKPTSQERRDAYINVVECCIGRLLRRYYNIDEELVGSDILGPKSASDSSTSSQEMHIFTDVQCPVTGAPSLSLYLEKPIQLGSPLGNLPEPKIPELLFLDDLGAASHNTCRRDQYFPDQRIGAQPGTSSQISGHQPGYFQHDTDQINHHMSCYQVRGQTIPNEDQFSMVQQIGTHPGAYFQNPEIYSGNIIPNIPQPDSTWYYPENTLQRIPSGVQCLPMQYTSAQPGVYPQYYDIDSGDFRFGTYESEIHHADAISGTTVPLVTSQSTALFYGQSPSQSATWSPPYIPGAYTPNLAMPELLPE